MPPVSTFICNTNCSRVSGWTPPFLKKIPPDPPLLKFLDLPLVFTSCLFQHWLARRESDWPRLNLVVRLHLTFNAPLPPKTTTTTTTNNSPWSLAVFHTPSWYVLLLQECSIHSICYQGPAMFPCCKHELQSLDKHIPGSP